MECFFWPPDAFYHELGVYFPTAPFIDHMADHAREPPLQGKRRVDPPGGPPLAATSAPPGGAGHYVILGDNQTR